LRRITLELAVLVIAVSAIQAQVNQKNEIGLLLGAVVTPSLNEEGGGNLKVGSGIAFQLTYARLLSSDSRIRLYFEVPALAIPLQDIRSSNGDIPLNYDSFFVTPSLRAKFRPDSTLSHGFLPAADMHSSTKAPAATTARTTLREVRVAEPCNLAEAWTFEHD